MPTPREIVSTLLGIRVARALHSRWRRMSAEDRDRLEPLADDVRRRALDLRGEVDPETAGRELREANLKLADAMVESAQSDPEVSETEVLRLREDLSRELERLAGADIKASRVADAAPSPGRTPTQQR
jgi:hypothetical protein